MGISTAASAYTDQFARLNLPPREQWPDLLFDLPELRYPARLNCVAELLDRQPDPARIAIRGARGQWSYAELLDQVNRIAAVLRGEMGLAAGNRVLLRGANHPMMAACILGVIKAGCIAVPTMPLLRGKELASIIAKAQVNAVLCADELRDELDTLERLPATLYFGAASDPGSGSDVAQGLEALMARQSGTFETVDTAADDICLISFTSGTTGVPKGTMHFHRDVLAICDCFPRSILQSRPDDVFIGTPPLAFTFGLGGLLLFPLRVGGCAVLLEKLTPESLLQAIQDHRASVCFTAPTFYRQMAPLVSDYDIGSLRRSVSAGEALPLATRDGWQAASGLAMIDGIGATELLHIFISAADGAIRRGATGKPVPGYQACILDRDGRRLGPGVIGRLAVKGPTGCRYLADPRQADYVFDGWNLTGDAYEMDQDGYFYYRSRTDDMIISSGYNIAGPEVEDALLRHPAVAECAVTGRPDERRGQIVEAHVVLKPGFDAGDEMARILQEFVKQEIAPYKYPRAVRFLPALPRTETGKLQRFKLRGKCLPG
ncbi:AMP-binding protein [Janthinobacterium agaricidamnosum]|uniref:AMP-binding enzyme family protein n=1 Tax=Janthinobacterium agaricidamnosum NBRC 102515 = DSM 9628 TaxID=1349767 RepID=W0VBH3_9BURK|nr:AMP-binding protein [Janthinobacterium agaricidamnosum]CDG84627.1 AMP-binding enzyme family protein [Janthinobacterium agaricidamnosum NBRC 102515 = DSM 9628]